LTVRTDVSLGADLALVGYSQNRDEVAPGDGVLVALGWQARRRPQTDYTARLELVAPEGQVLAQATLALASQQPTSQWTSGEVVVSKVGVHIPGWAESGPHVWRLVLQDSKGVEVGQTTLGSVQIIAPPRVFTAPPMPHPVDARLEHWAALVGFDAPERAVAGQPMPVTLVWQALGETDQNYKVFVHLFNPAGELVAQSDAEPANWTRPTSGWQAGEFVTDLHTLKLRPDLPAGEYRLAAGMYDSNTGRRLQTAGGGDRIELIKIQVSGR
jgi:hypothetical protein